MGLIKSYFENYWKIRLLMAGVAIIILGVFFMIRFDQLTAGIIASILGVVVVILSATLFKKKNQGSNI